MIVFRRFEVHTNLPKEEIVQKLYTFIDTKYGFFSADLTKGYRGTIDGDQFTLRIAYTHEKWFWKRRWRDVKTRDSQNSLDDFIGSGTIKRGITGSTLDVIVRLRQSAWLTLGLFFLGPFLISAWLHSGLNESYLVFLWPALIMAVSFCTLFMIYHLFCARSSARVMKRDLEALLDGSWEPLQVGYQSLPE